MFNVWKPHKEEDCYTLHPEKMPKVGKNPQGKETVKQEEETGQETIREGRIGVRVGRGQERKISLEIGFNLRTLEKQLGD